MATVIPCRGANGSHDDHDDSATRLHLPMAPNHHTEYPQAFHHPRQVNCIKIWCSMHQKWEFYLSDGSTRDPYQDPSTTPSLNCHQPLWQWWQWSQAEQAPHVAPYQVGKECNTLNTPVPPGIMTNFDYQLTIFRSSPHHCSLCADENSAMADSCTSSLTPTWPIHPPTKS